MRQKTIYNIHIFDGNYAIISYAEYLRLRSRAEQENYDIKFFHRVQDGVNLVFIDILPK